MLRAALPVLVTSWTACAFPAVIYDECAIPLDCNPDAYVSQVDDAATTRDACLADCKGQGACRRCSDDYEASVAASRGDCEVCAAQHGCDEPRAACMALISPDGLP